MAEDKKNPLSDMILAQKGSAQPWNRRRDEEREREDPQEEEHPQRLHTRPDLFGSSAVVQRPPESGSEGAEGGEVQPETPEQGQDPFAAGGREGAPEQAGGETGEPERRAADPIAEEAESTTPSPAEPGEHPARLAESLTFDDWPEASRASPYREQRQERDDTSPATPGRPDIAASWVDEVEAELPPLEDEADEHPDRFALDHGSQLDALDGPDEDSERRAGLAAALRLGRQEGSRNPGRWALTAGAVACGALLLAALVGGVLPLSDEDSSATRTAAKEETSKPAAEDDQMAEDGRGGPDTSLPETAQDAAGAPEADPTASAAADSEPSQTASSAPEGPSTSANTGAEEIPLVPAAGDNAGKSTTTASEGHILPDTTGPSGPADAPQVAAVPDPRGPEPGSSDEGPIVDFMRIDPDGRAVVAGRAAPGTKLVILDNGEELGTVTADIYGLWTFVSAEPMTSGRHEIGLKVHGPSSELSPTVVTDAGPSALDPAAGADLSDPLAESEPLAGGTAVSAGDLSQMQGDSLAKAPQTAAVTASDAGEAGAPAAAEADMPAAPRSEPEAAQSDAAMGSGEAADSAQSASAQSAATQQSAAAPRETSPEAGAAVDATAADLAAANSLAATSAASAEEPAAPAPAEETRTQVSALPELPPKPALKPETAVNVQPAAATPASGRYVVQLASFKNAASAARETAILEQRYADLLSGLELFVEQARLQDQNTVYRVRTGPFASLADARTTCARFKERDRDCLAMRR